MVPLIHDPEVCRLGSNNGIKPARIMLHDYVTSPLIFQQAPAVVINSNMPNMGPRTVTLAMYLNDQYGCCTCAAIGNILRVNSKDASEITDQDVETAYEAVTGEEGAAFNPGPPPVNDNGCAPLDVLDYWASTGVGGDKLLGHAGIDLTNHDEVRWAMWKTGSVYQAIQLAVEQQQQVLWDYVPGSTPGSWGGHLFPLFDRPAANRWTGGTWGAYKDQTDLFMSKQAVEGHALITDAFLAANATVLDVAQLRADLANLESEK